MRRHGRCAGADAPLRIPLETAVDAIKWLKQRVSSGRVGLYGISRGAEFAVLLASKLQATDLATAVAVHAPSDFVVGAFDPLKPNDGIMEYGPYGQFVSAPSWTWQGQDVQPGADGWTTGPRIEIERYPGPLLLSHGTNDQLWSVDRSKHLAAARQGTSLITETKYWQGEDHVVSPANYTAFTDMLATFFGKYIQ